MPPKKPATEKPAAATATATSGSHPAWDFGTVAMRAWAELGAEAVRFVWARLQQDVKTQQALLACTSLAEMQAVQAAFFTSAQEQYAAETGRVLERMGSLRTVGPLTPTMARRYDDVPL